MKIKNIEGLSVLQLQDEVNRGAKFVVYQYCISVLVLTFKRPSDIYFIPADGNRLTKGLPFTLISVLLGWWGIPWGPIYTIGSLVKNFGGGKDITQEIMNSLVAHQPLDEATITKEATT
ncbi:MAG: hypothetical protein JST86_10310 [Bacteroidetes bacterium]|nr:hypothetical protein [Bacteroidota bacterium]